MDKKALNEQDIRSKFIWPAILAAGWDAMRQVREEVQLTKGRVIVKGKVSARAEAKRLDYVLYHRSNLPIATDPFGQGEDAFRIQDFWELRDGDFITITHRPADLPGGVELPPH